MLCLFSICQRLFKDFLLERLGWYNLGSAVIKLSILSKHPAFANVIGCGLQQVECIPVVDGVGPGFAMALPAQLGL
jgi:hypothetical protein